MRPHPLSWNNGKEVMQMNEAEVDKTKAKTPVAKGDEKIASKPVEMPAAESMEAGAAGTMAEAPEKAGAEPEPPLRQVKIIHNFTKGNLSKDMLIFAVPFVLSNAMQMLYAVVDMVIVGQVMGSKGLSAVATASQVVTFMTVLCLGFAIGGQVYVSQLVGAGKKQELNAAIGTLFTILLGIGVVMSIAGILWHQSILQLLNTPPESYPHAVQYLLVCSAGMIFTYGYNMISAVLRGMGNSRQPFIYIAIATVINLVLDIVFVMYLGLEVFGAAVATIIGQAVSFAWAVSFLYRHKASFGFDFRLSSFAPNKRIAISLCKLGIPFCIAGASVYISMMFVNSLVNSVGVVASAVFGVGIKVDDFVRMTSMGIHYSVSTVVGQNIAARQLERTKKAVYLGWTYSFFIYVVFYLFYIFNIRTMFGLFTADEEVLSLAPVFVQAMLWNFPAIVIMRGTNGFIQGIGNSTFSLLISMLDGFVFRIGFSYLLGIKLGLGLYGFFLGYGLATYGTALPGLVYFYSNGWKKRVLDI